MGEVSDIFERFTERARLVVILAQDEARAIKHNYIGTEHLLLGLLREESGLAARTLEELGVSLEEVRVEVARIVGTGEEIKAGQLPFTPRAKKILELALREALSLGHNYIGTEHILLGLVRENEGVAARILLDFDVDAEKTRNKIIQMLSGPGRRQDPRGPVALPVASDPPVLVSPLNGCARCGNDHSHIEFVRMTRPLVLDGSELTHWATCPETGEPILMRFTVSL